MGFEGSCLRFFTLAVSYISLVSGPRESGPVSPHLLRKRIAFTPNFVFPTYRQPGQWQKMHSRQRDGERTTNQTGSTRDWNGRAVILEAPAEWSQLSLKGRVTSKYLL